MTKEKNTLDSGQSGKIRTYFLSRKKLKAVSLILIILAVLGGILWFKQKPLPPEVVFSEALQNLQKAQSYSFHAQIQYAGQDFAEEINGKWLSPDRIQIKGNFLNDQDSEIIQIGSKTWLKAPWTEDWSLFSGTRLSQTEIFYLELNPQLWVEIPAQTSIEQCSENSANQNWFLELQPTLPDSFFRERQLRLHYQLELNPKEKKIVQAKITAFTPEQEKYFEVQMSWFNLNQPLQIEAPKR